MGTYAIDVLGVGPFNGNEWPLVIVLRRQCGLTAAQCVVVSIYDYDSNVVSILFWAIKS